MPDITVTASTPLTISTSGDTVTYDTVTIKEGGFITIKTSCVFSCTTLIKETSAVAPSAYDFIIAGVDGSFNGDGTAGTNGDAGAKGQDKKCSAANFEHYCRGGSNGGAGQNGSNGNDGGNGKNGPSVKLNLGVVSGSVAISNCGGNGANGGAGGDGGAGGAGGVGGDGGKCGSIDSSGCKGGNGGDGGNGGRGGKAGNGANAGTVQVTYKAANEQSAVVGSTFPGAAGTPGKGGKGGAAGAAGAAGAHGGSAGTAGNQGEPGGNGGDGYPGSNTPSLIINGLLV